MQSFETRMFDEAACREAAREIVDELVHDLTDELEEKVFEALFNATIDDSPNDRTRSWDEILRTCDATVKQWAEAWAVGRNIVFKKRPNLHIVRNDEEGAP